LLTARPTRNAAQLRWLSEHDRELGCLLKEQDAACGERFALD
jgi:hypothetical protein